jgi:hypothetical protein
MQFFLKEEIATRLTKEDKRPTFTQFDKLEQMELRDKPVFTLFKIEIPMINVGGTREGSYKKAQLYQIVLGLFGVKTLGHNKKDDAVKFLLDTVRLEQIKYNNKLYERQKHRNIR